MTDSSDERLAAIFKKALDRIEQNTKSIPRELAAKQLSKAELKKWHARMINVPLDDERTTEADKATEWATDPLRGRILPIESVLIDQAQAGDGNAFGDLMRTYWIPSDGLIFSIVHNYEAAEDAKQLGFIKACRHIRTYAPEQGTFKQWLWSVLKNEAYDIYNARKEQAEHEQFSLNQLAAAIGKADESDTVPDWLEQIQVKYAIPSPERLAERQELLDTVEKGLGRLPPPQAKAIRLRMDGAKMSQIAEQMHKSEAAVKMLLQRGRDTLKAYCDAMLWAGQGQPPGASLYDEATDAPTIAIRTRRNTPSDKELKQSHRIGETVSQALDCLPQAQRRIFDLWRIGYRAQEIAEQLQEDRAAVTVQIKDAQQALHVHCRQHGIKGRVPLRICGTAAADSKYYESRPPKPL